MRVTDKIEITNEDNVALMARYPDNYFDLAIVDPPYGIGASGSFGHYWDSTKGKAATKSIRNTKKEWDFKTPDLTYFKELFRVSKNQIIWGGNYFTDKLPISRCWICYDKKQPELNSFGKFELAWASFDAIPLKFEFYPTHVTQGQRIHPTQKPVELYKWLLSKYAKPNDRILDTHLGSGSIAIACHDFGFELTACELDSDYYKASIERIKKHTAQGSLFAPEELLQQTKTLF